MSCHIGDWHVIVLFMQLTMAFSWTKIANYESSNSKIALVGDVIKVVVLSLMSGSIGRVELIKISQLVLNNIIIK